MARARARATHTIGFRHYTYGVWREPGTPVDASTWPNRALLEESGYLNKLPADSKVEVPEEAPASGVAVEHAGVTRPNPQDEKPKASARKPKGPR